MAECSSSPKEGSEVLGLRDIEEEEEEDEDEEEDDEEGVDEEETLTFPASLLLLI